MQKADSSLAPDLWRKAARLGWLGILIPAEYGGSGERLSDAAVLYEELGRGPLPGPFFSSGVLGALTVLEGASEEQRRRILPGVATGERVLTVAITEPNTSWGPAGITLAPQGRTAATRSTARSSSCPTPPRPPTSWSRSGPARARAT